MPDGAGIFNDRADDSFIILKKVGGDGARRSNCGKSSLLEDFDLMVSMWSFYLRAVLTLTPNSIKEETRSTINPLYSSGKRDS